MGKEKLRKFFFSHYNTRNTKRRQNLIPSQFVLSLLIGYMKSLFLKIIDHHIELGVIPLSKKIRKKMPKGGSILVQYNLQKNLHIKIDLLSKG